MNEKALMNISRANAKRFAKETPTELDKMADAVLTFHPKNKAKNLKPRKRRKAIHKKPIDVYGDGMREFLARQGAKRNVQDRESK